MGNSRKTFAERLSLKADFTPLPNSNSLFSQINEKLQKYVEKVRFIENIINFVAVGSYG